MAKRQNDDNLSLVPTDEDYAPSSNDTLRATDLASLLEGNPQAAAMAIKHKNKTVDTKNKAQDAQIRAIHSKLKVYQEESEEDNEGRDERIDALEDRVATSESGRKMDKKLVTWIVSIVSIIWAIIVFVLPLAWDIYKFLTKQG